MLANSPEYSIFHLVDFWAIRLLSINHFMHELHLICLLSDYNLPIVYIALLFLQHLRSIDTRTSFTCWGNLERWPFIKNDDK